MTNTSGPTSRSLEFEPVNNERLANLCGPFDEHLRLIERRLGIQIHNRGGEFHLKGAPSITEIAYNVLSQLYNDSADAVLDSEKVHLCLQAANADGNRPDSHQMKSIVTKRGIIRARGTNQNHYLTRVLEHDINFGIGPAGTGKTWLAVACAVQALEAGTIRRLVLVRPAVEAGERLGFLPGDMAQKIDPYLRPLYDALYEMLGFEKVTKLIERSVIEIAPLAFMRGRTLNEAFIILDEAQNTSVEQMKMFLTRIGFGSTAVITGDVTQIDLPKGQKSGLKQVAHILKDIEGISFTHFTSKDVVRHPLVARILDAYEKAEKNS